MSSSEIIINANSCLKNKDYLKAIELYNIAIEMDEKCKENYSNRSACYTNLNQGDKALEDANKCLDIDSNWDEAFLRLGQANMVMGRIESALEYFRKGLKLNSCNEELKYLIICAEEDLELEQNNKWFSKSKIDFSFSNTSTPANTKAYDY